jgi:cysteine desulfuration protein SufE
VPDLPAPLEEKLRALDLLEDRAERIEALISIADRFREVPPEIARRPFPEDARVPACESEAFVWSEDRPDGTLGLHFAVENPQGVSAKALAALLAQTLSGLPPGEVARVSPDVVYRIFGRELSMGKSMGLTAMVDMVRRQAEQRAEPRG